MPLIPRQPPNRDQLRRMRTDLHDTLDDALDHWTTIHQQAEDMRRGYTTTHPGTNGTSGTTIVEANATPHTDPGQQATDWLTHLTETIGHIWNIGSELKRLLPATDDEIEQTRGRPNTVENCVRCGQPAPDIHRIDGQPYCKNTCYYAEYRARRQAPNGPSPAEVQTQHTSPDGHGQ